MPVPPMHLHGCNNISRLRLNNTAWVQSKRADVSVAIGITMLSYAAPAFSGSPKQRKSKSEVAVSTPTFSGPQKRTEMLRHTSIIGDPQTKGDKINMGCLNPAFSGAKKRAEMLRHPCILGDAQAKGDKMRGGCLTPAFLGAQKRAEIL